VVDDLDAQLLLFEARDFELEDVLGVRLVDVGRRKRCGRDAGLVEDAPHPPLHRVQLLERIPSNELHS
jgi:hypothetical protein